jgi:LEA14-like dessication related protein
VLSVSLLLALLMLNACVSTRFEAPRLSIVNVGMVSADVFSQQFRIRLHVQNPNDRELPIKGIEYELFLQGDSFAEGISNQPFVVPALGEAEFDTEWCNFMKRRRTSPQQTQQQQWQQGSTAFAVKWC